MSSSVLTVLPYIGENTYISSKQISFGAFKNPIKPPKKVGPLYSGPTFISEETWDTFSKEAYQRGLSNDAFMKLLTKGSNYIPKILALDSKSAVVGSSRITTIIDGKQYFEKAKAMIKMAEINVEKGIKHAILIRGFEFQNLKVDAHKWGSHGAEKVAGWKEQQQILGMLLKKKEEFPEMKIQLELDAHKWYIDSFGRRRHYNNVEMMRFLKQKGFDVVPAPRAIQGGSALEHDKLVAIADEASERGVSALLGGMNMGSHSAANHDFCVAIDALPNKKHSEVDNIIQEHFVIPREFAWHRLGVTDFIQGPLTEAEQANYNGVRKEILDENVEYHRLLSEFFDTPEAKNRYKEGRVDSIKVHPIENPKILPLTTRPKEYEEIGHAGSESILKQVRHVITTAKKLRVGAFYASDPEFRKIIIQRYKSGELSDVKMLFEEADFPYCENAIEELRENGVPCLEYDGDDEILQRYHGKWITADDRYVLMGSANFSTRGMTQNLGKGYRNDYELTTAEIDKGIQDSFTGVKYHEDKLQIPSIAWDVSIKAYEELKQRAHYLKKMYTQLRNKGEVKFTFDNKEYEFKKSENFVKVNDEKHYFEDGDEKDAFAELRTILGYYNVIKRKQNSKPKHKRGNSEIAVYFESMALAKHFNTQMERDFKASVSEYDGLKKKVIPIKRPNAKLDTVG